MMPPVAETLLARYTELASQRVDASTPQDGGVALKDQAVHEQLLRSLRLVAKHSASSLLDTLLYWRSEALKCFKGKSLASSQKKLVIETTFLEAVLEILEGAPNGSDVHNRQAHSLLKLAFEWVLKCHVVVPDPELDRSRSLVTQLCGRLLGGMTPFRLAIISDNFIKELRSRLSGDTSEAHLQERATLFRLCDAMKALRLGFQSNEEVIMSTKFLEDIHPLKHVAREKKSQVHHALCDMLTIILRRLCSSGLVQKFSGDQSVLQRWYKSVENMRNDITKWTLDQKKHLGVGFPLLAVLISLEPDGTFSVQMANLVEQVRGRLTKDSKTRPLMLHCLQECIQAYLERNAGALQDKQIQEWLRSCLKAPMGYIIKGSLSLEQKPGQDLGATILSICQIVASKSPEFALEGLILELLQSDLYSCHAIGLQALRNMILSAPAASQQALAALHLTPSQQVMELMKSGVSPLDLYNAGHLSAGISDALGRILSSCQSLFGGLSISAVPRSVLDHVPKEKLMGLVVLKAALLCLPYVSPNWSSQAQAEMLASYTKHAHQDVRQQATRALYRVLRWQAAMRPFAVMALAKDVLSIPEDHPAVISSGLRLLIDLCSEWTKLLQASLDTPGEQHGGLESACEVHTQLEALAIVCLAASEPGIRIQAVSLLRVARTWLHTFVIAEVPQGGSNHLPQLIDIIEQVGPHVVRSCYWDFGHYSDLWRHWRPLPRECPSNLQGLISSSNKADQQDITNDPVRWARCLAEIIQRAAKLRSPAVVLAYQEVTARCYRMLHTQEAGHTVLRCSLVTESAARQQLWRNYSAVACACPPALADGARRGLAHRPMTQLVLSTMRVSQELHASGCMALGSCPARAELLDELKKALGSAADADRFKSKGKLSSSEVRVAFSHVIRLMAHNTAQPSSQPALLTRYSDFVISTADHCQRNSDLANFWDCQPLRYCCCSVVAACAGAMTSAGALSTPQRKTLFTLFDSWGKKATDLGRDLQSSKDPALCAREVASVLARVKDPEVKSLRAELLEQCEALQAVATQSMAALLVGPPIDGDTRLQGPVGTWIHQLFTSKRTPYAFGPPLAKVAQAALINILRSNPDLLLPVIDCCYLPDAVIANQYFNVMAEVYTLEPSTTLSAHILLSVVLYKLVEPSAEVREDAVTLLKVMSAQLWGSSKANTTYTVVGSLQDSYQQFQCQFSADMATEHPELSEQLCVEMLTRVLNVDNKVTRHQVLICVRPWMENLSFAGRESSWSNDLLKSLYFVTWQHGPQFPYEVERLWSTLAGNKRNIIPILDFLMRKGMDECASGDLEPVSVFFSVAKRICLYLARVASQQTVDHLVYEISQQLYEEDSSFSPAGRPPPQQFFSTQNHNLSAMEDPDAADSEISDTDSSGHNLTGGSAIVRRQSSGGGLASLSLASMRSPLQRGPPAAVLSTRSLLGMSSSVSESASNADADTSMASPSLGLAGQQVLTRPLSRSELALCLLAEVAYEHDEDFRSHLSLLFQVALICMDAMEPIVSHHCNLLVVNLLYSISVRHLEAGGGGLANTQAGALEEVSSAIQQLQSMRSCRLWAYEETTLERPHLESFVTLQAVTDTIVKAIVFESDLRERWGEEALSWAVECSSRHLSARSLQVFRALRLPLSSHRAASLLYSLHLVLSCAAQGPEVDVRALECGLDIIISLQALVDNTPAEKLVLYPQLFWACIALLPLPYPQLYRAVISLLFRILEKLDLNQVAVQNVVVAAVPGSSAWEVELSLSQSPMDSLNNSMSKQASGRDQQRRRSAWGGIPSWKAGEHLLLDRAALAAQQAAERGEAAGSQGAEEPSGSWQALAVQQLLLKGLYDEECELAAVLVMMHLADAMASDPLHLSANNSSTEGLWGPPGVYVDSVSTCAGVTMSLAGDSPAAFTAGVGVVLGPLDTQLLVMAVGLLPWVMSCGRDPLHLQLAATCAELLAAAAMAQGHEKLSAALRKLAGNLAMDRKDLMGELSRPLARAFFPRYGRMFCQLLLCTLSYGPRKFHSPVLSLLKGVLEVVDLQLDEAGEWLSSPGSFASVADLVGHATSSGPYLAQQAMEVLDLVMQRFPADSTRAQPSIKERWRVTGCSMATTATTTNPSEHPEVGGGGPAEGGGEAEALLQPADGLWMSCQALEAVLSTCHKAHASRVGKRGFMPFCASAERN